MREIGVILPSVLRQQVRGTDSALAELLAPLWPRVVGRALAQQCRPLAFEEGTLTVETSCTAWAAELRRLREEVRAVVNGYLGKPVVKKLRVQYAASETPAERPSAARVTLPVPASTPSLPDELGKLDAEISGIVARSFSKYFSRKIPN